MPAGRHLEQVYEFGAHRRILLSPEVIVRVGAQETEDTCKEGESPGLAEALPPPATVDTAPDRKVDEGDSLDPGDTVADPLLDARVLSVRRNSVGDRHREFRNAASELVQSPWLQIYERTRFASFGDEPRCARTQAALSRNRAWVAV